MEGECLDVSNGAFAPCTSDEQCFREGDGCNGGKCESRGDVEIDPIHVCKDDSECPQPACVPGMNCPRYVCTEQGCVKEEYPDIPCTKDAKRCPDGTLVSRSGPKCEFEACPSVICTADVKECPDGTYVPRSGPNCEFQACPPYFKCFDTEDCPDISCDDGDPCNQYICNEDRGICTEVEASCCKDPEPSQMECGRSGCHCCGDGVWLLGNSGPTLTTEQACGMRGPSKPCEHSKCSEDRDCPVLNCITAPCPSMECVNGECTLTEA